MSPFDFWHGDMELLEVYQKAYTRKTSYEAWVNGHYSMIAYGVVLANAFSKEAKSKYPEWVDPIPKIYKTKIKDEDFEQLFRNEQIAQNAWLRNLKNK